MKIYVKLIQTISKIYMGILCLTCRCFGNHILDSWVKQKMVSVLLCTGSQWWIFSKKHQETAHDSQFHSNVDKPNNEPPILILGGLDSVRPPISGEILFLCAPVTFRGTSSLTPRDASQLDHQGCTLSSPDAARSTDSGMLHQWGFPRISS